MFAIRKLFDSFWPTSICKLNSLRPTSIPKLFDSLRPTSIRKSFDSLTADFCDDYEPGPPAREEPQSRMYARAGLAIVSLVLLGVAIGKLTSQEPTLRTVRKWGREFPALQFSPYVNSSSGSITSKANSEIPSQLNMLCPCSVAYFSWTEYVIFYTVSPPKGPEGLVKTELLNSSRAFLQPSKFRQPKIMRDLAVQNVMQNMIGSVIDKSDARTNFVSTNLLDPRTLSETIAQRILFNLFNQKSYIFNLSEKKNGTREYLTKVYFLWKASASQNLKIQGSTDVDFWNAGKSFVRVTKARKAIGTRVNWTRYFEICDPPYCDNIIENGRSYRFLQAVVTIGGFATVVLLLVRKVMWPIICYKLP